MGLNERARQALEQVELESARREEERDAFIKAAHEEQQEQTIEAFQAHVNQWAEKLEVQAPVLRDVEYERRDKEPVHSALANFTIDGIDFRAYCSMLQFPDEAYGYHLREQPMHGLQVFLFRDKHNQYRIDSIQMLGKALRMTGKLESDT